MSSFVANVLEIQKSGTLHIVKFAFHKTVLSMMSLDLSENVKVGTEVRLVIKPTHIILSKEKELHLSCLNSFEAKVNAVDNGELLSSVTLEVYETILEAIVTQESLKKMNLVQGDSVKVFIPESELSIGEVLDA